MTHTVNGLDVSYWQPPDKLDYQAIADAGLKYAAVRCTVGDYYADSKFAQHWDGFGAAGLLRMPYMVIAPATSGGRAISSSQHMEKFLGHFSNRKAELPWVLDCELTRGQSRAYITELIAEVVAVCLAELGRYPIIYTRQTWWDPTVYPDPIWEKCPLWAARYSNYLDGPWSDGYYRFRDWPQWVFWQWTSHGRIPNYSGDIDLDRFNGDEADLAAFVDDLALEDKVNILWREAEAHGWSLVP